MSDPSNNVGHVEGRCGTRMLNDRCHALAVNMPSRFDSHLYSRESSYQALLLIRILVLILVLVLILARASLQVMPY